MASTETLDPLTIIRRSTRGRLGHGKKRTARCKAMIAPVSVSDPASLGIISGAKVSGTPSSKLVDLSISAGLSATTRPKPLVTTRQTGAGNFERIMRMATEDDDSSVESGLFISPCQLRPDSRKQPRGNSDDETAALNSDEDLFFPTPSFTSSLKAPAGMAPHSASQSPSPTYTLQSNNMMSALKEEIRQKQTKPKPPVLSYGQLGTSSSSKTLGDTASISSKSHMSTSSSVFGSNGSKPPKYFPVGALGRRDYSSRRSNQQQQIAPPITPVKFRQSIESRALLRAGGEGVSGHKKPATAAAASNQARNPIDWGMGYVPGGVRADEYNLTSDFDSRDFDGTEAISRLLLSTKRPVSRQMKVKRGKPARPKTSPTRLGAADGPLTAGPNHIMLPRAGFM